MTRAILTPEELAGTLASTTSNEPSVTAQEMARLTGVGRERLRTWERRHGFPIPTQSEHGNRQYRADDVARVIAVRQLAQEGVPLAQAVSAVCNGTVEDDSSLESLGPALDRASAPAVALGGPLPLRVLWANRQAREASGDLVVGATIGPDHPWFGRTAIEAIERLMADARDEAAVIDHGAPEGAPRVQSLAWRASTLRSGHPVVVVMGLPDDAVFRPTGTVDAGALHAEVGRWVDGVSRARQVLSTHTGLAGAQRSLRTLRESLDAIDAFLVFPDGGQLRCATSVRRIIAARVVAGGDCAAFLQGTSAGEVVWLPPAEGRAMGVPAGMRAVVIPLVAGGSSLGAAVVVFPGQFAIDELAGEIAVGYGTMLATMIQRDQAAARARHAARVAAGVASHQPA